MHVICGGGVHKCVWRVFQFLGCFWACLPYYIHVHVVHATLFCSAFSSCCPPTILHVHCAILNPMQFNQYWQLYSNHRFNNNTGDRGFWLILPNRREAPIWTSLKVGSGVWELLRF